MTKGKIDPSKEYMTDLEESTTLETRPEFYGSHNLEKARKHFVKFFIDICYYMCVFPYKIVESDCLNYKKKGFIPQQILCAIMHFVAIWDTVTHFRSYDLKSIAHNPRLYFDLFTTSVHLSVIFAFSYTMWKKADALCSLIQIVQRCSIISLWYPRWIYPLLSLVAVQYMTVALLCPIFVTGRGQLETWEEWYVFHVENGRHSLFLTTDPVDIVGSSQVNITDGVQSLTLPLIRMPEVLFFMFSYLLQSTEWIYIAMFGLIMIVMSLTLYCATNHFVGALKCYENSKLTLRNYEALKRLSSVINDINGTVTLTYTVDCIMYFATTMHPIITDGQWFARMTFMIFFMSSVGWLHFASYACLQMDRFRDWIRQKENRSLLPSQSITIILLMDEISTNVVGMSGHGLFTVNYKFVAQALTSLMTYFIIVIQFK